MDNFLRTELAKQIWCNKYQDEEETLDMWLDRVSGGNNELRQLIADRKFLFGGRILASRGLQHKRKVTFSNCYVLEGVPDNIEGIYDTASKIARTFSYGGGVGIDISNLRPKGAKVNNAAKTTTGPVSFMNTFSQVSETIGQSGRRGALMISMDINHDDIEEFIDAKKNTDKLQGCNISVRTDEGFMQSLSTNEKNARIFTKLAENNWDYAEPGILYWDNINNYNLLTEYIKAGEFKYSGVNPCAEEPLPAGGSCLLGAINLSEFVDNPFTDKASFNEDEFKRAVQIAVIGLNDVLDEGLELHPLEIQRKTVKDWRQIGLGIMGFADMLIKLGVAYGSHKSVAIIHQIGYILVNEGLQTSSEIAKLNGSFNKYDEDKILGSTFITSVATPDTINKIKENGLRNSQLFTIAPTGSISTMLGVSGGVEPIFDVSYTRTTKSLHDGDRTYKVFTPIVEECLIAKGLEVSEENYPEEIVWSKTIRGNDRVMVQAAWQNYIDASISSTVNLPNSASVEYVEKLYNLAWVAGCKGLTIFRENCARIGILNSDTGQSNAVEKEEQVSQLDTDISNCTAVGTKLQTGCGSLWLTAYFHKSTGQLCHLFLDKGSQGGCLSNMNAVSRLISGWSKDGADIDKIVDQLESVVPCPSYAVAKATKCDISKGKNCPSAIGRAIKQLHDNFIANLNTNHTKGVEVDTPQEGKPKCPSCGGELRMEGGCNSCPSCGYSKCD